MSYLREAWFLVAIIALMGVLMGYSLLTAVDPTFIVLEEILYGPGKHHILGTDELGRDILVRLSHGARLSLGVAIAVFILAGSIGTAVGVISGWCGGKTDVILMRVTDVFLSFPGILIAICFAALSGPGISNVILALGLMGWVGFARLARIQTLAIRREDYISAARLSGISSGAILFFYVLPNIAAPLVVEGVFVMAGAMIAEAGLSFLGIGIQPPQPSLGAMLREGARYMLMAPHLVLAPGVTLMLLVLTLGMLGDRLRDYLDVRDRLTKAL